jgi:hypothetical protein
VPGQVRSTKRSAYCYLEEQLHIHAVLYLTFYSVFHSNLLNHVSFFTAKEEYITKECTA